MIHDIQSAQILQEQDGHNIYVIIKTMCPSQWSHNGFVVIHVFCVNSKSCAQVHELPQSHCGDKLGGHVAYIFMEPQVYQVQDFI